jgi:arsenate reductase
VAEALGTAFLIIAVIGSGIMASRLSPDDVGLQLLENAAATAAALIGLILMFGAVSGAHFNPAVTLVDRLFGTITTKETILYVVAQVVGGCVGAVVANIMFELDRSTCRPRHDLRDALWLSEVIATIGLLLVIHAASAPTAPPQFRSPSGFGSVAPTGSRHRPSFANPAVTVARTLSGFVRRHHALVGADVHRHAT